MSRTLRGIEVVEDRTEGSRCDEGFLQVRRLMLRNEFDDGTFSDPYACDIVSRRYVDAVAVVLFDREGGDDTKVRVALRKGFRPPVALRKELNLPHEERDVLDLAEIVAGVLEDEDSIPGGVEIRAAAECVEEAGVVVAPEDVRPLGGGLFPTPGVSDERVLFRHVEADLDDRGEPEGDGSPMEAGQEVILLSVREAIRRCRSGEIPDMKTEVALLRLCDAVGYLPQFDLFLEDLPKKWQKVARRLPPLIQGRV